MTYLLTYLLTYLQSVEWWSAEATLTAKATLYCVCDKCYTVCSIKYSTTDEFQYRQNYSQSYKNQTEILDQTGHKHNWKFHWWLFASSSNHQRENVFVNMKMQSNCFAMKAVDSEQTFIQHLAREGQDKKLFICIFISLPLFLPIFSLPSPSLHSTPSTRLYPFTDPSPSS